MKTIAKKDNIPAGWIFSNQDRMVEFIYDITDSKLSICPRVSFRKSFGVKRESLKIEARVVAKK